jgi:hypothetical protein
MSVVLGVVLAREVNRYVIESLNLQLEEERRMENKYREKFLHDGRLRALFSRCKCHGSVGDSAASQQRLGGISAANGLTMARGGNGYRRQL